MKTLHKITKEELEDIQRCLPNLYDTIKYWLTVGSEEEIKLLYETYPHSIINEVRKGIK